jgi:hypothetical protein
MMINPTYTGKQYWLTTIISGLLLSLLLSATYVLFYQRLYVEHSFMFSIIYLIPLVWLTVTLAFFKMKFVLDEFSYRQAFVMSLVTGLISAAIFSVAVYFIYDYMEVGSRIKLYENGNKMRQLFSPKAAALSMLLINVILSIVYSLIIAIFARKKY